MATTETRQQAESRGGRHGFVSTYNRGCRCPECKRAKHEQYVRRKVRCASGPRTLMDDARELYKMVYWSGGEMRVFIFPPMDDEEEVGDEPSGRA